MNWVHVVVVETVFFNLASFSQDPNAMQNTVTLLKWLSID